MYDLLDPVLTYTIFASINLMPVYSSAKFQQFCDIFAKPTVIWKIRLIFRYLAFFLRTLLFISKARRVVFSASPICFINTFSAMSHSVTCEDEVKGTTARDFQPLVFFMKVDPWFMAYIIFEFGFKFAKIFKNIMCISAVRNSSKSR